MELTLFEVHLDDASFTANAPFSGDEDGEEFVESAAGEESNDEREDRSVLPFVVGLAFLAGLGYLVRRRRSGDSDDFATEVEPTVAEADAPTP